MEVQANATPRSTIADSQQVLVVGYPLGVPRKYSAGAETRVRDNTPADYFQANTDVNVGSSG